MAAIHFAGASECIHSPWLAAAALSEGNHSLSTVAS